VGDDLMSVEIDDAGHPTVKRRSKSGD
jgi:hypothetical protein